MVHSRYISSIVCFILLSCGLLKAGVEPTSSRIAGSQIIANASVAAFDSKSTLSPSVAKIAGVNGKVIFSVDKTSNVYPASNYTVVLGLEITTLDKNSVQNIVTTDLTVTYNTGQSYQNESVYTLTGCHYVMAEIKTVKDGYGNIIATNDIPQNLSLEVVQSTERYYVFNVFTPTTSIGSSAVPNSNEIDIHWAVIPGAEEYELEWTYVNDYSGIVATPLPTNSVTCNFRANSTRVRLSNNHYRVSLIFDQGYVVYRVRGVGRSFSDLSKELFGAWSAAESGTVSTYTSLHQVTSGSPHEINKNWQYSSSYAEDGKKKEVVSYFDGSLRNRQSVTKTNTENQTIVGETIYDYQGRGAIQVLPTPNTSTVVADHSTIKFFPDYNKVDATTEYTREDFDEDINGDCDVQAAGMHTSSGSSNYYSPQNPDDLSGVQGYVPDAKLFPFTQIEYTPDNTGRIRRQSGVGVDHNLVSNHETKYFYSQPEQVQLDRMFGSEVGDYMHYKKNMVVDANGQISVSYLDQQGRVVATSLAGVSPGNVTSLTASSSSVTVKYLDENGNGDGSNKIIGNALLFSKELSVATAGTYTFSYDMEAPKFTPCPTQSATICYDCIYDFEMSLKNSCGDEMFPLSTYSTELSVPVRIGTIDSLCGAAITFSVVPTLLAANTFTTNLAVGSYTLYKKLTISEDAVNAYEDDYLATSNTVCITPFSTFTASAMAAIDTNACNMDCAQCETALGALSTHTVAANADPDSPTYDSAYVYMTEAQFNAAVKECREPCLLPNLCEAQYQTLLSDVSPGGQYAKYSFDPVLNIVEVKDYLSLMDNHGIVAGANAWWREPTTPYKDADGNDSRIYVKKINGDYYPEVLAGCTINTVTIGGQVQEYIYPEDLALTIDFINFFSSHREWAKSLVAYHPEYKYYQWCVKNNDPDFSKFNTGNPAADYTSDSFDDLLRSLTTYAAATATLSITQTGVADLIGHDPYFQNTSPSDGQGFTNGQYNFMNYILVNYKGTVGDMKNMKEVAAAAIRCGTQYYGTCTSSFGDGSDVAIKDKEWALYRDSYLAEKQKLQQAAAEKYAQSTSPDPAKTNSCIGIKDGSFYPWVHGPFNWYSGTGNPCGPNSWFWFKNKIKRFQNGRDIMAGVDPLSDPQTGLDIFANNVNYNMYLKTGQCPVALDLEFLLNDLAQNASATWLSASSIDLTAFPGFTKNLYDALDPVLATFKTFHWVPTDPGTGSTFTADFKVDGIGTPSATITLTLPSGEWSDVQRFSRIHFTNKSGSVWNFTINAFLDAGVGFPPTKVVVTGNIDKAISGCTFEDNCKASPMAFKLQNLFNTLLANSTFTVNPVNLLSATSPNLSPYVSIFSNNALDPYTTLNWIGSTTTNVSLVSQLTSQTNTVTCDFSFDYAGTMTDIKYFDHIRPHATDPAKFILDAWILDASAAGGHFVTTTVTNSQGCYNFKECLPPPDLSCTGPEYKVNQGLLAGLNAFASEKKLIPSVAVTLGTEFKDVFGYNECQNLKWEVLPGHYNATAKTLTVSIVCENSGMWYAKCFITMALTETSKSFDDIVSFSNMAVSSLGDGYAFEVTANFSDNTRQTVNCSTTCLLLKPCEPCTPVLKAFAEESFDGNPDPQYTTSGGSWSLVSNWNGAVYSHSSPATGQFLKVETDGFTPPYTVTRTFPGIVTNTDYVLSFWVSKLVDDNFTSSQSGQVDINGVSYPFSLANKPFFQWHRVEVKWNSETASGNVAFAIKFNNDEDGYPLGVDDIKLEHSTPCVPCIDHVLAGAENFDGAGAATYTVTGGESDLVTSAYSSLGDHSVPSTGKHLLFTMQTSPFVPMTWYKVFPGIEANTDYTFSSWIASLSTAFPAGHDVAVEVNGVTYPFSFAGKPAYQWNEMAVNWNSGALTGTVTITIELNSYVRLQVLDDIKLLKTAPCDEDKADPSELVEIPYKNPCVEQLLAVAEFNAHAAYNAYIKDEKKKFHDDYLAKCKEALENLTMMYTDREHHVTLYYYDQAGSLIKTVPPAGVVLETNQTYLDQIRDDRKNNKQTYFTKHTMQTRYEYNSLGQLLRQATPDNELTNKWTLNGAPALPATVNIYGMAFSNGTNGFVVGDDGTNGVIYITTDGGDNWSSVSTVGIGNLKDVQFIPSTTTGYAISELGYLLKSTDGGATWTTVPTGTNQRLNDLHFFSASSGVVIGNAGTILRTTDNGATWTSIVASTAYPTANFNDLHFIDGTKGYIAGDQATLMRTTDAGVTWIDVPPNKLNAGINFNAVHFVSETLGVVAGVNNNGDGFIAKATLDLTSNPNSTTWTFPTSALPTGTAFKSVFAINTTTVFASGTNGKLCLSVNGGSTYSVVPVVSLAGSAEISELTFPASGTQGYATAKNGVFIRSNASGTTWTSYTVTVGALDNVTPLNGIFIDDAAPLVAYAAGNGGLILKTTDVSQSTITWNSLTNVPFEKLKGACHVPNTSVGYAVGEGSASPLKYSEIVTTTDGGNTWTPVVHTVSTTTLNAVACESPTVAITVGDGGTVLKVMGSNTVTAITSGTSSPLNAIVNRSGSDYVVVGNAGAVVRGASSSGTWTTTTISGTPNLHSVYFVDGNKGFTCGSSGSVFQTTDGGVNWSATGSTGVSVTLKEIYFKDFLTGYVMGDNGYILKTTDGGTNWNVQSSTGLSGQNFNAAVFTNNGEALIAGTGTPNLAELKDESFDYSSRFWYDRLGRLIVSQNTKQFNKTTKAYSYTRYDDLGRISEVGEIATASDIAALANLHGVISSEAAYTSWLAAGTRTEITKTTYDLSANLSTFPQENLRTRVSHITLDDDQNTGNGYNHATYFTYDIHGNVSSLLQHNPALSGFANQEYKRTDYVYDLVSGNVNMVKYQDGQADAFYHKYEYDADNRITNVFTSCNSSPFGGGGEGAGWTQDAKYFYYKHGPLARAEIGDQKVQGMDYAYTIQGWIKGVNSNNMVEQNDIGRDGDISTSNTNEKIARDAMGYSLGYFGDDASTGSVVETDYSSIGGNSFIASVTAAAYLSTDAPNLYNGNISHMVSSIRDIDPGNGVTDGTALPQLTAYKYDQLNRISQMKAYRGLSGNDWQNATTNGDYKETFSYDANGNIDTLTRNGNKSGSLQEMDDLGYVYKTHADGRKSNQLIQVQELNGTVASGDYTEDIDDQSANNYTYDEIGNLKSDDQEEILNIEWTVYGKIKKVVRTTASTKDDLEFKYDASGNRVAKIVKPDGSSVENGGSDNPALWTTTYYVRDASGNTMATYEDKPSNSDLFLQEQNIFGSSRLGVHSRDLNLTTPPAATPNIFTQTLGKKNYELSNHLGNVLSTVSDRKLPVDVQPDGIVDYYTADITSANDYYSFGSPMPGRTFSSPSYRYGYNGMEKDDEITNNSGTNYTTHFRAYDARLGRWMSVDPEADEQPYQSPYCAMDNNPIKNTDIMGDCVTCDFLDGVAQGVLSGAADLVTGFVAGGGNLVAAAGNAILRPDIAINNIGNALHDFDAGTTLSNINTNLNNVLKEQGAKLKYGTAREQGQVVGGVIFGVVSAVTGAGEVKAATTAVKVAKSEGVVAKAGQGGRLGNSTTRAQVDGIATTLEKKGYEITGGGNRLPEEYLKPQGGGKKGGSYPDITATKDGKTLRVNTVDTKKGGGMTKREATNAARIRSQTPGDHLLTVPKTK